ncbi:hypothetical protein [Streptomyces sp. NPDC057257]|uniref:hypothetical protein n=1 Tax=Streptomyces sp. NPDC057257 TaxID=3346071 RepID=UPI00362A117A
MPSGPGATGNRGLGAGVPPRALRRVAEVRGGARSPASRAGAHRLLLHISTDTYDQHNPEAGDGLDGFGAAGRWAEQGKNLLYKTVHRVVAEGDFVLLRSEGGFGARSPTGTSSASRAEVSPDGSRVAGGIRDEATDGWNDQDAAEGWWCAAGPVVELGDDAQTRVGARARAGRRQWPGGSFRS